MNRLWRWLMSYLAMYEEHAEDDVEEHELLHKWGSLVVKYEGGEWGATIADNPDDPGGKSYGPFQMSSHAGTVQRFVAQCQYKAFFAGLTVGTFPFDEQWIKLSEEKGFLYEQETYMKQRFFNPAKAFASQQGFDLEDRGVQEAIFSLAVQHRGWKKIIRAARKTAEEKGALAQLQALYKARRNYVNSLTTLTPLLKTALMHRYDRELADVISIHEHYSV